MVFLDVVLVALVAGTLLGGKLSTLADTPIRGMRFAFAAIALQVVAFPSDVLPWQTPSSVARVLWLVSYALLIAMLLQNARLLGVRFIALGLLSNLAAIVANGGLMPVRPSVLAATHHAYSVHNNSIKIARPHLSGLVDRWAVPDWIPLGNVYSVGDVLIAVGVFLAIVAAMRASQPVAVVPRHATEAAH